MRHWDNHSYLTINYDTGQHSQFLRCFFLCWSYKSYWCPYFLSGSLKIHWNSELQITKASGTFLGNFGRSGLGKDKDFCFVEQYSNLQYSNFANVLSLLISQKLFVSLFFVRLFKNLPKLWTQNYKSKWNFSRQFRKKWIR